jgi:Secretion system C-terminal sorting domain
MKRFLLLPALLAMFQLQAQQIEEYRYWINDEPAGVTVAGIGPNTQVNLVSNLVLPTLTKDFNTITIQFKDTNDVYSAPVSRIFTRNTCDVVGYEYWIDDDIANRAAGTVTAGTVVNLTSNIPLCLTAGSHVFAIRFQGASGTWSVPITRQFTSAASPDTDGDGLCDALDPCPLIANVVPGQSCNDNNACTENDVVDSNCNCAGTFADADNDGTCDASDLCPGGPEPGTPCDDGNANTSGDVIGPNCICAGALIDCLGVPGGTAVPGTPCNDSNACTTNDIYQLDCGCAGTFQDSDGDGTCDANDLCPGSPEPGSPCNDNNACTTGDVVDASCNCAGTFADADNDGTCDADDLCASGPEPGTPCNDANAATENDVIGANCLCAGTPVGCAPNLQLEFQLDGASTVTWELRTQGTNTVAQSGSAFLPVTGGLAQTACLPDGCYYLVVTDDGGDGITGNGTQGGYILRELPTRRIVDNRNNFLSGSTSQIANNQGFCLPFGNDRLISTSCDRLQLQRGATSACSDKLTADNTPNNTIGNVYQFQVFDPNGSEAPVLVPATGAGSNILAMNQLPTLTPGKLYNVRVRTRISAGVYRPWGPACRMSIGITGSICPTTQLVDDTSSPNWSCGKSVTLPTGGNGAANMLVAVPVTRFNANCQSVSANKYQFRFRDVDTNIITVVNGVGTNSYCYMTAPTFQPCREYAVDVHASFNNGSTWCDYGTVCEVFTSGCSVGSLNAVTDQGTALQMYPNPNRGDQLMLVLEHIEAGASTVSVDIYDSFGKHVSTRTIAVADGFINTVVELNGELATGLYVVNVTAGERVFTERLVMQP